MARLIDAFEQFFDISGEPLVGGKLWFYQSGSSTVAKDTYSDPNENIPNSNPVILNGDGRCPDVYGSSSYRVILTDSDDVQILPRDPVGGNIGQTFGADWAAGIFYSIYDVVRDDGEYWISQVSENQGNQPSTDGGSNWEEWPNNIQSDQVAFDNTGTDYAADNVQDALVETDTRIKDVDQKTDDNASDIATLQGIASNPNLFINGDFKISQEWAASPSISAGQYGADGWTTTTSSALFAIGDDGEQSNLFVNRVSSSTIRSAVQPVPLYNGSETVDFSIGAQFTLTFEAYTDQTSDMHTPAMQVTNWFGDSISVTDPNQSLDISQNPQTPEQWVKHEFRINITQDATGLKALWFRLQLIYNPAQDGSVGLRLRNAKLERGGVATPFLIPDPAIELQRAQRFYEKSYNPEIYPGAASTFGAIGINARGGLAEECGGEFKVTKNSTPVVTIYSPVTGAAGNVDVATVGDSTATASQIGINAIGYIGDVTPTAAVNGRIRFHWIADSRI